MNKSINTDLRNKTSPVAPAAKQATSRPSSIAGFSGNLPLSPGAFAPNASNLTPTERKMLTAAGWKEGQMIPTNLPAILAAEVDEMLSSSQTMLADPKTPPFVPPTPIPFDELPLNKQKEIMEAIAKVSAPPNKPAENPAANEGRVIEVVNTRKITKPIPPATTEPIVVEEKKEETSTAGGAAVDINCEHCGWPKGTSDIIATKEDKYGFMQAILGQTRFVKTYKLFDGKMLVSFRSLTTEESDLIFRQLAIDVKKERITNSTDYMFNMINYRVVCGLSKIESDNTGPIVLPEISQYKVDGDDAFQPQSANKDTKLFEITPHVINTALPQESIRRLVVNHFARFQRLVEHLEARIDDEGFWMATEPQH